MKKKYTADDIKVDRWDVHARKYPKMYFGDEGATPKGIAECFEYVAKILGGRNTKIKELGEWWYFCCDVDWLFKSSIEVDSINDLFFKIQPFPEAKQVNTFRLEALSTPFSTDVFTYAGDSVTIIKGSAPEQDVLNTHLSELGKWERIIGFKYDENA